MECQSAWPASGLGQLPSATSLTLRLLAQGWAPHRDPALPFIKAPSLRPQHTSSPGRPAWATACHCFSWLWYTPCPLSHHLSPESRPQPKRICSLEASGVHVHSLLPSQSAGVGGVVGERAGVCPEAEPKWVTLGQGPCNWACICVQRGHL